MGTPLPNGDPGSDEMVVSQTVRRNLVGAVHVSVNEQSVVIGTNEQGPILALNAVAALVGRNVLDVVGAIEGMGQQIDWNGRIKIDHELREDVGRADSPHGESPGTGPAFECVGVHDAFGARV